MVLVVIDKEAMAEALEVARRMGAAIWAGSDALGVDEHRQLVAEGLRVTRFTHPLSGDSAEALENDLETVREHHPGETVWVQRPTMS